MISWAKHAVLYEVNIRQFTPAGTFNAFIPHLARLKNMGVDIIWLMPVTPISKLKRQGKLGSYYACSSYTALNEEFGNENDFKNLITQAHQLELKVIIDWVANHTGCDHEWTVSNPDFYIKDIDGNFTERNGWQDVIDLDYSNFLMQQSMIESMQYWIENFDVDGFRCDMAHLVPLNFWEIAKTKCDEIKSLFWLAECDDESYFKVFDVSYAWSWMHLTEKLIKQEANLKDLQNNLNSYLQLPKDKLKLFFTSNHDENSWNGTEFEKYGILSKAFAVLSFTWLGMPLIYSGQEIPNCKRLQFFEKDNLIWNDEFKYQEFYSKLAAIHKNEKFNNSEISCLPSDQSNSIFSFYKKQGNNILLVILNLSKKDRIQYKLDSYFLNGTFKNSFSNLEYQFSETENFELMAGEFLVYEKLIN